MTETIGIHEITSRLHLMIFFETQQHVNLHSTFAHLVTKLVVTWLDLGPQKKQLRAVDLIFLMV